MSEGCTVKARSPIFDGCRQPISQPDQLSNLPFKSGDLFGCHCCNSSTRGSASIALLKNPRKFYKAEAHLERASDRPNSDHRVGRKEAIPPFRPQRLRKKAKLFVVTNCVGAYACGGSQLPRCKHVIADSAHHLALSMNPGTDSRVKQKLDPRKFLDGKGRSSSDQIGDVACHCDTPDLKQTAVLLTNVALFDRYLVQVFDFPRKQPSAINLNPARPTLKRGEQPCNPA